MMITYLDAKHLDYCNRGMRAFCAKHGFDYQDFKTNGIDADELRKLDDAMANDLITYVETKVTE